MAYNFRLFSFLICLEGLCLWHYKNNLWAGTAPYRFLSEMMSVILLFSGMALCNLDRVPLNNNDMDKIAKECGWKYILM
jgi:hypothetical protein